MLHSLLSLWASHHQPLTCSRDFRCNVTVTLYLLCMLSLFWTISLSNTSLSPSSSYCISYTSSLFICFLCCISSCPLLCHFILLTLSLHLSQSPLALWQVEKKKKTVCGERNETNDWRYFCWLERWKEICTVKWNSGFKLLPVKCSYALLSSSSTCSKVLHAMSQIPGELHKNIGRTFLV